MRHLFPHAVLCCWLMACAGSMQRGPAHGAQQPPSGAQLLEIADLLTATGEHVRAGQYLNLAVQQGVPEHEVLPRLLKLYAADGQYRLAIDHAETFLQRHPRDLRVRLCLASLYLAIGADLDAGREFGKVVAAEPKNAEAHFALASLLHASGIEHARSDQHYRAYLTLEPEGAHAEEARASLLTEVP